MLKKIIKCDIIKFELPMSFNSYGTSSLYKRKIEGDVVGSRPIGARVTYQSIHLALNSILNMLIRIL